MLDVKKLENIGEVAMSRMLMTSSETLQSLKLSYKSQSSFTRTTMAQLARCAKLTSLELASSAEYI